ncbi:hypothetical protein U0070_015200, partial [Myodes glareolus]
MQNKTEQEFAKLCKEHNFARKGIFCRLRENLSEDSFQPYGKTKVRSLHGNISSVLSKVLVMKLSDTKEFQKYFYIQYNHCCGKSYAFNQSRYWRINKESLLSVPKLVTLQGMVMSVTQAVKRLQKQNTIDTKNHCGSKLEIEVGALIKSLESSLDINGSGSCFLYVKTTSALLIMMSNFCSFTIVRTPLAAMASPFTIMPHDQCYPRKAQAESAELTDEKIHFKRSGNRKGN